MSVIPILVCYNYIFPSAFQGFFLIKTNISLVFLVIFSIVFAILGFIIAKEMIDNVIRISSDAKIIAKGNLEHEISIRREDEIGDLGKSLSDLTNRIKDNMSELQSYSEKTKEINLEINKRVLALSNLLHISNLISQGAALNEILEIVTEKITNVGDSELGFLILYNETTKDFTLRTMHGPKSLRLRTLGMERFNIKPGKGALGRLIQDRETLVLDNRQPITKEIEEFQKNFTIVNALVVPVVIHDKVYGILGIGNENINFVYSTSDLELLNIFSKQTAIAIENDILLRKVDKLEIRDALTGLYNESYIRTRLDEEIKRAINFQRPCAFILLDIDNFKNYGERFGRIEEETALKKIATILQDSVRNIDKVARFGDSEYAIILPEKNKRQCFEFAEGLRKKIEYIFSEETEPEKKLTVSGVVTENPIDGITSEELVSKATEILNENKNKGKNKIWL
jgi:diguanylate cyclase (GGDEF)-like protein